MTLAHAAIFLAAAIVAVPLFARLGLGSVLGYLAAGAAIGPSGLRLIYEVDETMHFAEYGVVMLLFLIGLELQPARLYRMRGAVFGLGGAQLAATTVLLVPLMMALGIEWRAALVAGLALSLSSTAFALQVLGEKNELGTAHGQSAFGILLFQDIAAIPILAIVPMLASHVAEGTASAAGAHGGGGEFSFAGAAIAAGVIAALVVAGRFLVRPAFRVIAQVGSHELSIAAALFVVTGTALTMALVGVSMALGAFIAGVLLADSEYRHELEANIEPFKGLLLGLFFMAVGMSADLSLLASHPVSVVGLALGLVAVKCIVLYALGRFARLNHAASISLAVAISQGGEFAFVIFGVGLQSQVLSQHDTAMMVVVVTLSMAVTPLLFLARDAWLRRITARDGQRPFDELHDEGSRVIIAGFGRFGQIVGRTLRLKRIAFTALDASPQHVDFLRRFGNRIFYGDASRPDLLRAAGAEKAEIFVLAIDDMEASLRTLRVVQAQFPHLTVVARARNRQHAYALIGHGVTHVIRETFAASVDASRVVLEELGLPSQEAREALTRFAAYDEQMLVQAAAVRDDEKKLIEQAKQYTAELERIFEQDAKRD